jgi:hypothetical protein
MEWVMDSRREEASGMENSVTYLPSRAGAAMCFTVLGAHPTVIRTNKLNRRNKSLFMPDTFIIHAKTGFLHIDFRVNCLTFCSNLQKYGNDQPIFSLETFTCKKFFLPGKSLYLHPFYLL